jgi:hypothetical protein
MNKMIMSAATVLLTIAIAGALRVTVANAGTPSVNCDAVMQQIYAGKHVRQVARDLKIPVYSVNRCKRHAAAAAKAETKTTTLSHPDAAAGQAAAAARARAAQEANPPSER